MTNNKTMIYTYKKIKIFFKSALPYTVGLKLRIPSDKICPKVWYTVYF